MAYTYEYPRPALTVDCVVFGYDTRDLKILLIQRELEPFKGEWALPGGFVRMEETLDQAALRELEEEAGAKKVYLEQLYTFGGLDRDPRGRTVSVVYYALVKTDDHSLKSSTDAKNAKWFSVNDLPRLAFDHKEIIQTSLERLKGKVRYRPIGFELLPAKFTLTQLQQLYETILERPLDKRNFRKKVASYKLLTPLDEFEKNVSHRAAQFYKFDTKAYKQLEKQGFNFEV